jgi:hypothetical protein
VQFGEALATSNVWLVFLAGHAFQIEGKNYLAGVDTRTAVEQSVKYSGRDLDNVLDIMKVRLRRRTLSFSTPAGTIPLQAGRDRSRRTNWLLAMRRRVLS